MSSEVRFERVSPTEDMTQWENKKNEKGSRQLHLKGDSLSEVHAAVRAYSDWLRLGLDGEYFFDVDFVEAKKKNGVPEPTLIKEITTYTYSNGDKTQKLSQRYLDAIITRLFQKTGSGNMIKHIADMLKLPMVVVVIPRDGDMTQNFYVYSCNTKKWYIFTPDQWKLFLEKRVYTKENLYIEQMTNV